MTRDRIVLVTRRTRLEELVARFNSAMQAKFYIEHAGGDYDDYEQEHDTYQQAVERLHRELGRAAKVQAIDRAFLPTYLFSDREIVVAAGQDGLVANAAKYVKGLPLVGVNPDPQRFDGVLLPFRVDGARGAAERALAGSALTRRVSMAAARLGDGQRILAFNDLFIGASTHVSARYQIKYGGRRESHSSSGIIVSTGAGSTGWLSSVFNMAAALGGGAHRPELQWEDERLFFVVREPFISRSSQAGIVAGEIARNAALELESRMPGSGVIFSDGIEQDFLQFNSGAIARISLAEEHANLVVPG